VRDNKYKFLPLPPNFDPIDATIDEVASWRRESRWTVHLKMRAGVYRFYKDGRITKIIFASVKADRERSLNAALAPSKRRPGRPCKPRADAPAVAAE